MWEQNLEIGSGDVEEEINLMNFLVRFSMLEKFFCSVFQLSDTVKKKIHNSTFQVKISV